MSSERVVRIDPDPAERVNARLGEASLQRVLNALHDDGQVLLTQVVDHAPLTRLKSRMDADSAELLAYCDSIGGNPRDRGHLQQGPPVSLPYVSNDLVANPFVTQVLRAVLGDGAYCEFYNGNTNAPGSTQQAVHLDALHPDPTVATAVPTFAVVMNVVPQDVSVANGAIELWPGTHRVVAPQLVPEDLLEKRRAQRAPVRGEFGKGDVLLRDSRLWHRGVPNPSQEFRQMIALVFVAAHVQKKVPLQFTRDCELLLQAAPLAFHAEFLDEPVDYLLGPTKRVYARKLAAERKRQAAAIG